MHNIRLEVLRRVTAFLLVFFIAGSGFGLSGCSSKKDNQAGTVGSTEVQSTAVADDIVVKSASLNAGLLSLITTYGSP